MPTQQQQQRSHADRVRHVRRVALRHLSPAAAVANDSLLDNPSGHVDAQIESADDDHGALPPLPPPSALPSPAHRPPSSDPRRTAPAPTRSIPLPSAFHPIASQLIPPSSNGSISSPGSESGSVSDILPSKTPSSFARKLGLLKLSAGTNIASNSSVHQIFQDHLSQVFRASYSGLACLRFSLSLCSSNLASTNCSHPRHKSTSQTDATTADAAAAAPPPPSPPTLDTAGSSNTSTSTTSPNNTTITQSGFLKGIFGKPSLLHATLGNNVVSAASTSSIITATTTVATTTNNANPYSATDGRETSHHHKPHESDENTNPSITDIDPLPFYTSEWVDMSLNPTWESVRSTAFESNSTASSTTLPNHNTTENTISDTRFILKIYAYLFDPPGVRLLLRRVIHLSKMVHVGKDLADVDTQFQPNTILIELGDGFYMPVTDRLDALPMRDGSSVRSDNRDVHSIMASYIINGTRSTTAFPWPPFAPASASASSGTGNTITPTSLYDDAGDNEDQDAAVQVVKIDTSRVRLSYKYDTIQRIVKLERDIASTQRHTEAILQTANTLAQKMENRATLTHERQRLRSRIRQIDKSMMEQTQAMQTTSMRLQEIRALMRARRDRLTRHQLDRHEEIRSFVRARDGLALTRCEMNRTLRKCGRRRQQLVRDLNTIFPIKPTEDGKHMTIRGLVLPNANFSGHDDDKIATALGFTVHYIHLIAYYLDVPLRYPMVSMSSRSTVYDTISLQFQGSKMFTLYARRSERIRFEYAVFLLNKNVEQLLNVVGRPVRNLRNMLPNVVELVQAVEGWRMGSSSENGDDDNDDDGDDWAGVRWTPSGTDVSVSHAGAPVAASVVSATSAPSVSASVTSASALTHNGGNVM